MASILVADSGKGMGKQYPDVIDLMGHDLVRCETGKELLEILQLVTVNLIILDVDIDDISVMDLCKKIRANPGFIDIPIIIASEKDSDESVLDAIHAGANDYLFKPIEETPLITKVNNNLQTLFVHTKDLLYAKKKVLFAGRYKIDRVLAYGTHAINFIAYDQLQGNQQVTVKLLNRNLLTEEVVERFKDLASRIQKANLTNYIDVIDFGEVEGKHFIVLDYAAGGNLATQINYKKLSEHQLLAVANDVLMGIISLHNAGIQHLNIKPENILLNKGKYSLSDFGIILERLTNTLPLHAEIWSTTAYMAPENFEKGELDSKSDVYSLGVTLYQALTGDNPFAANNPTVSMSRQINLIPPDASSFNKQISYETSKVISSMLAKNPDERPSPDSLLNTFKELARAKEKGLLNYPHKERATLEKEDEYVASDLLRRLSEQGVKNRQEIHGKTRKQNALWDRSISELYVNSFIPKIVPGIAVILVLCLSVGIGLGAYKLFFDYDYEKLKPAAPTGVVRCKKCGYVDIVPVRDIKECRCSRCDGQVKYGVDCYSCANTFPLTYWEPDHLDKAEDPMEKMVDYYWCPVCGSYDNGLLPLDYDKEYFETIGVDDVFKETE